MNELVPTEIPIEPPSTPANAVDHVGFPYLPAGLRRAPEDGTRLGTGWSATAGRWSDGRRDVEITVVRGGVLHGSQWVNAFLRGEKRQPLGPRGQHIRTTGQGGRPGAFWEDREVAVHIEVSPDLTGELDKIVEGVRCPKPPATPKGPVLSCPYLALRAAGGS